MPTIARPLVTPARTASAPARAGFSLLEMMLVVLIIGILMGVVVISMSGQTDGVRRTATVAKLKQVKTALEGYLGQHGTYPPTELGLTPLATGVSKQLDRVPLDEWKSPFYYAFPSASGNPERPFDLKSPGRDRQLNTQDDIDIWTVDQGS
jgi:general secretion pathway protein G